MGLEESFRRTPEQGPPWERRQCANTLHQHLYNQFFCLVIGHTNQCSEGSSWLYALGCSWWCLRDPVMLDWNWASLMQNTQSVVLSPQPSAFHHVKKGKRLACVCALFLGDRFALVQLQYQRQGLPYLTQIYCSSRNLLCCMGPSV